MIVEGYRDEQSRCQARCHGQVSLALREFGSELISQRHANAAKRKVDNLLKAPDAEKWEVIDDSADRFVVDILVAGNSSLRPQQVPFVNTRMVLDLLNGDWHISDVLYECFSCNSNRKSRTVNAGHCSLCDGAGNLEPFIEGGCKQCDASGKCKWCIGSEFPGWKRAPFLS